MLKPKELEGLAIVIAKGRGFGCQKQRACGLPIVRRPGAQEHYWKLNGKPAKNEWGKSGQNLLAMLLSKPRTALNGSTASPVF